MTVLPVSLCRFIYVGVTIVCLCLSVYFIVTNSFIPFRLPLVNALSISFPGGRREAFLFLGLAGNLACFFNGFLSLIRGHCVNAFLYYKQYFSYIVAVCSNSQI